MKVFCVQSMRACGRVAGKSFRERGLYEWVSECGVKGVCHLGYYRVCLLAEPLRSKERKKNEIYYYAKYKLETVRNFDSGWLRRACLSILVICKYQPMSFPWQVRSFQLTPSGNQVRTNCFVWSSWKSDLNKDFEGLAKLLSLLDRWLSSMLVMVSSGKFHDEHPGAVFAACEWAMLWPLHQDGFWQDERQCFYTPSF